MSGLSAWNIFSDGRGLSCIQVKSLELSFLLFYITCPSIHFPSFSHSRLLFSEPPEFLFGRTLETQKFYSWLNMCIYAQQIYDLK